MRAVFFHCSFFTSINKFKVCFQTVAGIAADVQLERARFSRIFPAVRIKFQHFFCNFKIYAFFFPSFQKDFFISFQFFHGTHDRSE